MSDTAVFQYECRVPLSSLGGGSCEAYTISDLQFESDDDGMCRQQSSSITYEMCSQYQGFDFIEQTCQETYSNYMLFMAAQGMTCDSPIGDSMMTAEQMFSAMQCCESTVSSTSQPGTNFY